MFGWWAWEGGLSLHLWSTRFPPAEGYLLPCTHPSLGLVYQLPLYHPEGIRVSARLLVNISALGYSPWDLAAFQATCPESRAEVFSASGHPETSFFSYLAPQARGALVSGNFSLFSFGPRGLFLHNQTLFLFPSSQVRAQTFRHRLIKLWARYLTYWKQLQVHSDGRR